MTNIPNSRNPDNFYSEPTLEITAQQSQTVKKECLSSLHLQLHAISDSFLNWNIHPPYIVKSFTSHLTRWSTYLAFLSSSVELLFFSEFSKVLYICRQKFEIVFLKIFYNEICQYSKNNRKI